MLPSIDRLTRRAPRPLAVVLPLLGLLLAASCKGTLDKVNGMLYKAPGDGGWAADSALVASNPRVLFRVVGARGPEQRVMPIATLGAAGIRPLRMTNRGWHAFDIAVMFGGKEITPVREGMAAPAVRMTRGMWEGAPLDTLNGCPVLIPVGQVSLGAGVELAVANYTPHTGSTTLDAAQLEEAVRQVPTLVTPALGLSGSELARFDRHIHQIVHARDAPSILLQYDDPRPVPDTGSVRSHRPHNLIIILDKGVYGYRASWVYGTTGMNTSVAKDRPILRYLDALDTDDDGTPELFFSIDYEFGTFTTMFRRWNDTWRESWRRNPIRCDS